jgi:dephospho-CoA kinase
VIVGVAGKYCAGKNAVSRILEEHGYAVIEVDKLGHRALEARKDAVVERFGIDILQPAEGPSSERAVDRRALGAKVFGDERARRDLEAILHPVMIEWVREFVRSLKGAPGVINAAILFDMGLHRECDAVVWVTAPLPMRMRRARRRDGLSYREVFRRFRAQRRVRPQQSSGDVEIHTVDNRGSYEALEAQLRSRGLIS